MTIAKQLHIGWVNDEKGQLHFVVIDSNPITQASCEESLRRLEAVQQAAEIVPMVFLEPQADHSGLRSWLQSEALRRFAAAPPSRPRP